ncbi:hypothetical protein A2U01_0095975, partial [Trifolium medium]|nr:hypothetical protein [Trifolium medium]
RNPFRADWAVGAFVSIPKEKGRRAPHWEDVLHISRVIEITPWT